MTITALTDTELLEQARNGDEAAFTELYVRHQPAAQRLARSYRRLGDPDDLVNGAFERVLGALRRGAGPTESFRAYLFVTLRRLAADQGDRPADESIDEVPEPINEAAVAGELAMADREIITRAFEDLPDRWQAVLWHTAVEGRQPRELAGVLGVTANAAAAMSYRAREKLRQSYLQAHLQTSPAPDHEPWRSQLGAYVRDGLSARDRAAVDKHLERCESCRALLADLRDVNRSLARAVLPLFVLVGGGKLAAGAAAGGAAAGAGADTGLFAKLRRAAPTVGSTAAIAAVVGGIVGMGTAVSREDGRPLNSAADAADIGGNHDGSGSDGADGRGDDGDSDSLFGDEDFALSPFDDPGDQLDDFGDDFDFDDEFDDGSTFDDDLDTFDDDFDFGDEFDFDDDIGGDSVLPRSRPGATPTAPPSGSNPTPTPAPGGGPAPTPPPATPPPATPPPATPPPGNPPPNPPPTPVELAIASTGWAPAADGTGTLTVTVGEAGAAAAVSPLAAADAARASGLVLDVTLNGGAQFVRQGQPAGCTVTGANIRCSFAQPATGGNAPFALLVNQASQAQTATVTILRDGVAEGDAVEVDLPRYGAGLALAPVTTASLTGGDGSALPGVLATFGVTNTADHAVSSATVTITSADDVAFVPSGADVDAAVAALESRLTGRGWAAGVGEAFRQALTAPLPAGCSADVAADTIDWDTALSGGLPRTVTCTVGPVPAGGTVTLGKVLVLAHPAFFDGDGQEESGRVTATLRLVPDGAALGEPQAFTLTPFRPPEGGAALQSEAPAG